MDLKETIARWDTFLARIEDRAKETLAQAQEGCEALIDANDLDPLPMTNAWHAIEQQVRDLLSKVQATWKQNVAPALDEAACGPAVVLEQDGKAREHRVRVEKARDTAGIAIFASAARKILAQAKANLARDFHCTQCGAQLPVSDRFFRSRHVPCPYCNGVNTFVPGTKVQAVEHFCCHHLAREAARDLWFAWEAAEARMKAEGAHDLSIIRAAERALSDYTKAYLRARIEVIPEYEKDLDRDLRGGMAQFYEGLQDYPAWKGQSPTSRSP